MILPNTYGVKIPLWNRSNSSAYFNSWEKFFSALCESALWDKELWKDSPFQKISTLLLLAWWNIALQQSQRTKNNKHQKKPRVISNYRWWKEEVKETISSKWATFNKFGLNQVFKAIVWNGKKWSEIDYDSRKNGSNFFCQKVTKV